MVPDKKDLHELGYFTKLHGYKGELTAYLDTEFLQDYEDLDAVFIETKGQIVPYIVELLETKTNKTVKVKLEGVDDEATAKLLVKSKIFIRKEDVSETDESRIELKNLVGYTAIDEREGELGRVNQIMELSGNPQLEIDYQGKMILLPLHEDFILQIDHDKKIVHVSAPEGLIDLFM